MLRIEGNKCGPGERMFRKACVCHRLVIVAMSPSEVLGEGSQLCVKCVEHAWEETAAEPGAPGHGVLHQNGCG